MSSKRFPFTSVRLSVLGVLLVSRFGFAEHASAAETSPSRAECARAFEDAQRLRNVARYIDATREVLTCTRPSCGSAISEECAKIYSELEVATPSVVFGARDRSGKELASATAQIDDNGVELALDGKPVALDPGSHQFSFRADGFAPQTQSVVIRAGERFRAISVVLEPAAGSAPSPGESRSLVSSERPPQAAVPTGVYVLGGVALVGVAGFAGFRWWGSNEFDDLSSSCKPDCSSSSVDAVRQKYLFSNISLAVGGAAAVAAVTWYIIAPGSTPTSAARLQILPSADGASARFSASF
ncbi:MAG TPA: hypothetical protein VHB79_04495 [Polyangiaceae bacterium]|nr:hypothetical protein [Polyangiaceae bacterium]